MERYTIGLVAALMVACQPGGQGQVAQIQADEIRAKGMVEKAEVGVNCWRLAAEDGTSYELRADQAPVELLVHGRKATVVLKLRTDLMSVCQVGKLVDVVRVE
ncbi:MAG: hypothetical protein SGJ01_03715 [Gemmatimonadota bacterium]|nr:hypothetical protein [Gemmatimonadota bacterium]